MSLNNPLQENSMKWKMKWKWNKGLKKTDEEKPVENTPAAEGESVKEAGTPKNFFTSLWVNLNPQKKQRVTIIAIAMIFILITAGLVMMSSFMGKKKGEVNLSQKDKVAQKNYGKMSLLSDRVERDLWVAAEGQNIKALEKENADTKAMLTTIRSDLDAIMTKQKTQGSENDKPGNAKQENIKIPPVPGKTGIVPPPPPPPPVSNKGIPQQQTAMPAGGHQVPSNVTAVRASGGIRVVEDEQKGKSEEPGQALKKKVKHDEWLPTGSFMKAVLLNGIDAPTSGGAQAEPYPVLMSIMDLSILPNRFRLDIRECFVIGAGYGNISDERAYIRTERLSCVRKNGQAVDFELSGHIIGEDGKLGLRGRVVSKQGQQIAMALFAGTLSGFSTAMKPVGTVKLDITGGSEDSKTTTATRSGVDDVLASAGLGGAGSALDKVAQYYLRMAEKLFPVIEIDAGRHIEVVILKGRSLKDAEEGGSNEFKASK